MMALGGSPVARSRNRSLMLESGTGHLSACQQGLDHGESNTVPGRAAPSGRSASSLPVRASLINHLIGAGAGGLVMTGALGAKLCVMPFGRLAPARIRVVESKLSGDERCPRRHGPWYHEVRFGT
jgi:hypothetical protein